jgi:hypothetical protein
VGFAFACLALCWTGSTAPADIWGGPLRPEPRLQPAYRAEQFIDSLGINASLFGRPKAPPKNPPKTTGTGAPQKALDGMQTFLDLGVRYYRESMRYGLLPDAPQRATAAFEKYGVRPMVLVDGLRDGDPAKVVAFLHQYGPGVLAAVEGPNEVNNKFGSDLNLKYKGKIDEAAGAAYMDDLYKNIKSDPAEQDIPVVSFTAIFTDYRMAKPHASFDYANMHSYQGNDVPSSSLEMNTTRFNNLLPVGGATKLFMPTECGYNVQRDVTNHLGTVGSLASQARNIPMLYAEYFRHGIKRTYLFALPNVDGYGLMESGGQILRPSYFAVKSLVSQLKDASWNPETKKWEGGDFTPRALLFDMPGAPQTVHTLVLEKKSGEYSLLIWNEVPNYDNAAKTEVNPAPVPVSIVFKTPVAPGATILTQNSKGEYDSSEGAMSDNALRIPVFSSISIVKIIPRATQPVNIAAPAGLRGEASESESRLTWQPVASAAGYFVFRNGWHIGTVTSPEFQDDSSWLRPGLGYTYQVQAFDATGNMSLRSDAFVQTAARFPDLVVTELRPEKGSIAAGELVHFVTKLKNAGKGGTPPGIDCSVVWSVDGKGGGFTSVRGPLKPGEERVITAGKWTATPGAHVLRCLIDDINRLPGENKRNNVSDCTFNVGETGAGMLMGSTQAAPGQVDLTAEGTLDWINWGLGKKDSVNRKATGGELFSSLTKTGPGYLDATNGAPVALSWSDGSPEKQVASTHAGLWWNFAGTSESFSVPADATSRVLRVYVSGIQGVSGMLTAKLSDGSAPPYVSHSWNANGGNGDWAVVPDEFSAVYTIHFRAATQNQKLIVEWKLASDPDRFSGQARLQAATLTTETQQPVP